MRGVLADDHSRIVTTRRLALPVLRQRFIE
jgi:hypothetical protein